MPCLSLAATLGIVGWSLLGVTVTYHVHLATHTPYVGTGAWYTDAPSWDFEAPQGGQPGAMRRYDAVIVGAGWAGLKAARTLLDSGVSNVLVLEADGYVGGRSKSVNQDGSINAPSTSVDNVPVEFGSEWLYDGNSMAEYLDEHHITDGASIIDPEAYSGLLRGATYYRQTRRGDAVSTEEIEHYTKRKDNAWDKIRSFRWDRLQRPNWARESWGRLLDAYKSKRNVGDEEVEYIGLLEDVSKIEYTSEIDQLSLKFDLLDQEVPTTKYMGIPGLGFGNVASRFAEQFSSKIKLNSKVTEITHYHRGQNAVVKFTNNGRIEKVSARTVLLTASLGVLKAGHIRFAPPLPRYKRDVIDGMGFGLVNKCAMYWNDTSSSIVWPKDEFWFKLVKPDETRYTYFFNPSSYKGTATLTAWIGGDDAVEMERRTDDEVLDDFVMGHLKSMFPNIRRPDKVYVTRWGREENVLGTYVYPAARRNFVSDTNDLKRRVGALWFAGEATTHGWPGTTVGAWRTGTEAAEEMAEAVMPVPGVAQE